MTGSFVVKPYGRFWKIVHYDNGYRIAELEASFSRRNDASKVAVNLQLGLVQPKDVVSIIDAWVPEEHTEAGETGETGYEGVR